MQESALHSASKVEEFRLLGLSVKGLQNGSLGRVGVGNGCGKVLQRLACCTRDTQSLQKDVLPMLAPQITTLDKTLCCSRCCQCIHPSRGCGRAESKVDATSWQSFHDRNIAEPR